MTRLASCAPELATALTARRGNGPLLRHVAHQISEAAVAAVSLEDERIAAALGGLASRRVASTAERAAVLALVEELDDAAWALQERAGEESSDNNDYRATFARARTAAAVWSALDPDPLEAALEAAYEAQAASGNLSATQAVILSLLVDPAPSGTAARRRHGERHAVR